LAAWSSDRNIPIFSCLVAKNKKFSRQRMRVS
jgi:hypothetical protein